MTEKTKEPDSKAKECVCPKCKTPSPKQVGKPFKDHHYLKCKNGKCGFTWPVRDK